ncbi:MAG: hypothetical protein SWE60_10330, partial [Thermodesulfobacteriota bacterium]|nr:hypothetical protein [Thermodesulfobacteriota bacterium]
EEKHGLCKVRGRKDNPCPLMADVVILAEEAKKIAMGEEYRPRSVLSYKGAFFSKMGAVARHDGQLPGLADAPVTGKTIYSTGPRTESTGPKAFVRFVNLLPQEATVSGFYVCREKGTHVLPTILWPGLRTVSHALWTFPSIASGPHGLPQVFLRRTVLS